MATNYQRSNQQYEGEAYESNPAKGAMYQQNNYPQPYQMQ